MNRNKRSVALDLKDPGDLAIARTIALRSDVVIENFRPGVMARAGLDHATLPPTGPTSSRAGSQGSGAATSPGTTSSLRRWAG